MKRIPIPRKENISPSEFVRDHLEGLGTPVIVTDATANWPALKKWTFGFLRDTYGSDFATAPLGLMGDISRVTRVGDYIAHLDGDTMESPGFWVETKTGRPIREGPTSSELPPYLMGWHAFQEHPELYDDIKPAFYFVSDWVLSLDASMRDLIQRTSGREYWSIYIGPKDSLSPLHQDFWQTHSCLAQIQGSKRAILFSPEDTEYLYSGAFDPEFPNFEEHQLASKATAYEGIIGPGEVLFMPGDWWHHVRGLEPSITVSHNFFNSVNFSEHLKGIVQNIPYLAKTIDAVPELRDRLAITWRSKGFEKTPG